MDDTRLAAARLRAAEAQPYLALALYALTPVEDKTQETFAVDEQWRLYVNPERLTEWSVPENAAVLLHEVGHLIRDHAGRARTLTVQPGATARLWNVAADAEINDDLHATGLPLPGTPVTPNLLGLPAGMVAEYYYSRLVSAPPDLDVPDCGTGCHGQVSDTMHVGLPAGLSSVEALLLRKRTAEQIVLAVNGLAAGDVPGGWIRWADALLHPQLDWRKLLSAAIRSAVAAVIGNADYSYARLSRRRVPNVILPAMTRPIPRVAIIVDTSGSVDDAMLQAAWSEVHGCLRRMGTRRDLLTVYAADVNVQRLSGVPKRQVALSGGGGTDMAAAIEAILRPATKPDLVVVITDGLTPWPHSRPVRPVVVALLPTEFAFQPTTPTWARVIKIAGGERQTPRQRRPNV